MSGTGDLAIIALGSNLGDAARHVLEAMDRLQEITRVPLLRSSLWQSAPVDYPPGSPPFINAVVALEPGAGETPESLLRKLQELERAFGRRAKKILNEPRPLDLDLITFRGQVRRDPELVLPHPRTHQRRFVLEPLSEIAPDLLLPGQTQTVQQLLHSQPPDPSVRKLPFSSALNPNRNRNPNLRIPKLRPKAKD